MPKVLTPACETEGGSATGPVQHTLASPLAVPCPADGSVLARRSGYTLLGRVVMAASRGAGLVFVSRVLGAGDFGEYSLVVASYAIASGLGTLGLDQASVYLTSSRLRSRSAMLRNALWLSGMLGIPVAVLLLGGAHLLSHRIFNGTPPTALWVTAAALAPTLLQNSLSGMVVGRAWFRYYGFVEAAKWTLHLVLVVWLAAAGRLSITTAAVALYAPIALTGLLHLAVLARAEQVHPRHLAWIRPDCGGVRALFAYGVPAALVNVTHVLHMRLDVYVIKYFSSSAVVGQYALAVSITDVLLYLGRSVGLVLFAERAAAGREMDQRVARLARGMVAVIGAAALLVLVVGEPLVALLFGAAYIGCLGAVTCRLPGLLAESGSLVLVGDFLGRARMRALLAVNGLTVAIGFGANLLLVPLGGITAAAAAFSFASWIRMIMLARLHARESGLPLRSYFVIDRDDGKAFLKCSNALRTVGRAG
jgi:O-antigen/teichoic acid export membrane protein